MNKIGIIIIAIVSIAASQPSQAQDSLAASLYGWTRIRDVNGNIDLVRINETTGVASFVASISLASAGVPAGYEALQLTYDPTDGNFYGNLRNGGSVLFAKITPEGTLTTVSYTGDILESPVEGIEYSKNLGGIIISGGDVLYRVTHGGVVSNKTFTNPPLFDQDTLGANSLGWFGGQLHVFDSNNPNGGYSINYWNEPPGPFDPNHTITHVYNGPVTNTESDLAVNAFNNTFYTSDHSRLLRFKLSPTQSEEVVGNYNYPGDISGIAYVVPEPTTLMLAALGLAGGLLGRSRGSHRGFRRRV